MQVGTWDRSCECGKGYEPGGTNCQKCSPGSATIDGDLTDTAGTCACPSPTARGPGQHPLDDILEAVERTPRAPASGYVCVRACACRDIYADLQAS